jgi:hypothetical protein
LKDPLQKACGPKEGQAVQYDELFFLGGFVAEKCETQQGQKGEGGQKASHDHDVEGQVWRHSFTFGYLSCAEQTEAALYRETKEQGHGQGEFHITINVRAKDSSQVGERQESEDFAQGLTP